MTHLQHWQQDGYLVLRGALDRARVARLRENCDAALERWKRDSRPEVEPFNQAYGPNAWYVTHINHPKHHRDTPGSLALLLGTIADPMVLAVVRELMRDQPLMMQANYYINPLKPRVGAWHRDCQFFAPGDEAAERIQFEQEIDPPREFHMHIPLTPTAATEVVPGSHKRWDTPEENHIRRLDSTSAQMPDALRLHLEPGDLAFFHVNAMHRGLYEPEVLRRTIAVSWSNTHNHRAITRKWLTEWNGYVAHCQPWFLRPGYLDGLPTEARVFYEAQIAALRGEWQQPGLFDDLTPERRGYFFEGSHAADHPLPAKPEKTGAAVTP